MVSELQRERKYVLGMRNIEYTFPNSKITWKTIQLFSQECQIMLNETASFRTYEQKCKAQ
jgi:hypothetical protein